MVFKVINGKGTCNTSTGQVGYFGNKVLAVSYGGSLYLTAYKGATHQTREAKQEGDALSPGRSWRQLADGHSLAAGATFLYMQYDNDLDPALTDLGWKRNDEIVVTATDYLPGHSERLKVRTISSSQRDKLVRVDFDALDNPPGKMGLQWPHNGVRYGGPNDTAPRKLTDRLPPRLKNSLDSDPLGVVNSGAETRAAVALLSRSIRIVSAGDAAGQDFPAENSGSTYSYGGHMIVRQGFKVVQIQGVEFVLMGQGGRLGHYPSTSITANTCAGPYDGPDGYLREATRRSTNR